LYALGQTPTEADIKNIEKETGKKQFELADFLAIAQKRVALNRQAPDIEDQIKEAFKVITDLIEDVLDEKNATLAGRSVTYFVDLGQKEHGHCRCQRTASHSDHHRRKADY
jgi:hypothetical protein